MFPRFWKIVLHLFFLKLTIKSTGFRLMLISLLNPEIWLVMFFNRVCGKVVCGINMKRCMLMWEACCGNKIFAGACWVGAWKRQFGKYIAWFWWGSRFLLYNNSEKFIEKSHFSINYGKWAVIFLYAEKMYMLHSKLVKLFSADEKTVVTMIVVWLLMVVILVMLFVIDLNESFMEVLL